MQQTSQPRTVIGRFTGWEHGAPQVTLGGGLIDADLLTPAEARKLDEHLSERPRDSTQTYAELYDSLDTTHVAQEIVFVRRGAAPELVWRIHGLSGDPVIVPPYVARACTVPNTSEPAIALKHKRDRARVAKEKATEERARRGGRVRREVFAELRAKENRATERFLEAEAAYTAAIADPMADAARSALEHWADPVSQSFRDSGYLTPAHVMS